MSSRFFKYRQCGWLPALAVLAMLCSCSVTKFVEDDEYLLQKVKVVSDDKTFNSSPLEGYVRQKANSKWFSLFKIPLRTYALAGKDTTRWINRVLMKIGEPPVIYDSIQAAATCNDLRMAMQTLGYLDAEARVDLTPNGRKLKAVYVLHPGRPYVINRVAYDIQDPQIRQLIDFANPANQKLKSGMTFNYNDLDTERKRIATQLMDSGYYRFQKEFIQYEADSTTAGDHQVDLVLQLRPYNIDASGNITPHSRYFLRQVNYIPNNKGKLPLRRNVLFNNTLLYEGMPYSSTGLQRTYNNFARLQAVKYTNIRFTEVPDTTLLDCDVQVSTQKPSTISFQPEGTNTAGDLGAAAVLGYENRNLFRGSELLSIQLRAAFEAITGLEGYQNEDYEEYGIETKLSFPRMLSPLVSNRFKRNSKASTELSMSYNSQNRPEFHRRVFSTTWRYRWNAPWQRSSYRIDLPDLNYVYMPWISPTFKQDYLDNATNRNAILRYNYEDLFIMKVGFGYSYNGRHSSFRANVETAGNALTLASNLWGSAKNSNGQRTLFNIAFAQYAKGDFDYTRVLNLDRNNALAIHAALGIAYPYGNSNVLPFEKRYFSGGANSVRGWSVRGLGPGRFKGTNGRIDFINQTGDMKIDLSIEYRTALFWKFNGALFVDAGNIWTLREYADQPGGQFHIDRFYEEMAVAYGLGLRLNFDYFILRFDMGMKAVNPAYENKKQHFPILHPDLSRDFAFHFAVGMPF